MSVFFVYSTGRCATQFLTRYFSENLGEAAIVEHEPLGPQWVPRSALRHPDLGALRRELPRVDRHLDRISEAVARGQTYIETGWPAFAWFPYLKQLFGADFRWAHLIRNPLYVAGSMMTHQFYDTARSDRLHELALLEPTDHGVAYRDLAGEWESLSRFEKCLYQWLEINRYALEFADNCGSDAAPVFRYDDIFANDSELLKKLFRVADMGDPKLAAMPPFDRYQRAARERPVVSSARLWGEVEELAHRFHYEPEEINFGQIANRVWHRYSHAGRGATGLKKGRRLIKSLCLDFLGC